MSSLEMETRPLTMASGCARLLDKVILRVEQLLAIAVAAFLAADVALIFFAVLARYLLNSPIGWSEEIARLFLACFTFLGMALAFRRGQHLAIFAFVNLLSSRSQNVVAVTRNLLIAAFSLGFAWVGLGVAIHRWDQLTPALGFSEGWSVVPMVIGLFLMAAFALLNIRGTPARLAIATSVFVLTLAGLLVLTLKIWLPVAQQLHPLVIIVPIYLAAMAAGLPLGFDIVFAAVGYLLIADAIPISIVAQRMHEGVNHFVLIAVPFFVLAGAIMEKGGISGRLVNVAHALIGHVRGGLGQVTILSMILFSGVSGSKTADISAVGSSLLPQMRKHGANPNEAVAVLSSSAAMAESIPPSLALIVLGSISSLSVIALFMAGIVPALVIAVCLMLLVYVRARRGGAVAEPRAPISDVMRALYRAGLGLAMPVLLLTALRMGIATPTEVSAFAVVYALLVTRYAYRELSLSQLYLCLVGSACMTGVVLFMVSSAFVLAWVVSAEGIPQAAAEWVVNSLQSPYLFMALSLCLVLVLGAVLEGLPALVVLTPLLLPAAKQIGIDPLHYGMVMVIAMSVGASAPIIGICTITACAVGGTTIESVTRPYLPYYIALIAGLGIVAFVPWFTLVLPHAFGLGR